MRTVCSGGALDQLGLQDQGTDEIVHTLIDQVQQLADQSRCFPSASLQATRSHHAPLCLRQQSLADNDSEDHSIS